MWAVFPGREAKPLLPPPRGAVSPPPSGRSRLRRTRRQGALCPAAPPLRQRAGKGREGRGGAAASGLQGAPRAASGGRGGRESGAGGRGRTRVRAGKHVRAQGGHARGCCTPMCTRACAHVHKSVRAHVPASAHIMQSSCTHIYTRAGMYGCVWIRAHTRACTQRAGSCCRTPLRCVCRGSWGSTRLVLPTALMLLSPQSTGGDGEHRGCGCPGMRSLEKLGCKVVWFYPSDAPIRILQPHGNTSRIIYYFLFLLI